MDKQRNLPEREKGLVFVVYSNTGPSVPGQQDGIN
jgi:hypothetical protein